MDVEAMLPQQQNTNRPPPTVSLSEIKAFELTKLDLINFNDLIQRSSQDSGVEFELFFSNSSESQWGYLRVVDGKPKKVVLLLELIVLRAIPVNPQGLEADGYVITYCKSLQCNVTETYVPQTALRRNKLTEFFSLPPPCSKRVEDLCERLLKFLILKKAGEGGRSDYFEIGSMQGWHITSNGSLRFEAKNNYPEILYPYLPTSILHCEKAILRMHNAEIRAHMRLKTNDILFECMDLRALYLLRILSYNASFIHRLGVDFDLLPSVVPSASITPAIITAMLKNDGFVDRESLTLGGNLKQLKERLAERNDTAAVILDDTKPDEEKRRRTAISAIESIILSKSPNNHFVTVIISKFAAQQILPDLCCPLVMSDFISNCEPTHLCRLFEARDAEYITKIENAYRDYKETFRSIFTQVSLSIPQNIPKCRRSAYIALITAARTYDAFHTPLFGEETEHFVVSWLTQESEHVKPVDETLMNLFGQCLNQEIQNGRFNFIKRTKYIKFDRNTDSIITDDDNIYIETAVVEDLAVNKLNLRSVNALTDALKANDCLHINDHHSKCYRFLVQNSAGEAYWLYTYGISKLLITAENRQKIACADLQRYFLDSSDFENTGILPLGTTKDGYLFGKDIRSKFKRNDSIIITGQSGTGKSFCGINLLPSFAMLGHRVVAFDTSGSFTRDEVLRALPKEVVNALFSFVTITQGERLPIDPLFIGDCKGLRAKKRRVVSFITTAAGKLDNEEVKILDGLVSDMLKKHNKLDTVPVQMLREMLKQGGKTGCKVYTMINSVLEDIQTIGCQKQGWNQFFEASRKIPVILLENEEDSRVHPLLDVLLASLLAWQRDHKSVPLAIAIDELKQQTFTNGSPLHSLLTEGRKFGAKLIGMTQDYVSRENPAMDVMWEAGIKIFFAPSKSHERIASELEFSNVADAGFGAMKVGDLFLKADLFNKIDGVNEPVVVPGRTVKFVDSPLYAKFQHEFCDALPECDADESDII